MDTKLIKNKILKDLEKYIVVILLIFFSISLVGTLREYENFENSIYDSDFVKNHFFVLDSKLNEYRKFFLDLNGNKKEEVYKEKIEEIELGKEVRLKETENNIRAIAEEDELSEEEVTKQIEEAKKIIMEEDISTSVEDHFNYVRESTNNILYENINIEFFFRDESGAKITNIEDSDIEKQIEENSFINDKNYYYMYFPNSEVKEEKNLYSKELESIYDCINYDRDDLVKFYRIPKELSQGDILYDKFLQRKEASEILNRKMAITSIIGIFILIVVFIIYKKRKNSWTNYLEDLLLKIPIDIRAVIFTCSFNTLRSLIFNVIPYYEKSSYSNGVILKSYIFIILDYYFLKDIVLILSSKRNLNHLFILKIFKVLKESEFVKTNKFKVSFVIGISALAMILFITPMLWPWAHSIISFARLFLPVYIVSACGFLLSILREISILESKTLEVAKGNYRYDIKGNKIIVLKNIENNLITIEDGLKEALDKAITSEKMKSELITNVSHDLKTPLTSIINYIDLLKEENITDEKKRKYLEVLDIKSKRLKILIEDLFEASKAVSGNMNFMKEDLNIVSLLRQVIGELEEKISQANLDIITKWPEEKAMLYLDGRKTFRVYENLINNIIKYSMKNSRVYIDVINNEDDVIVIMKNISAYQINFTEEEIIERFKRGDQSRSTEGSGLGLSIAKSIVELQGGDFKIEIDGDLFKVITKFNKNK
ncbi:sensor histidine kinase [Clostridium nigeriense]|uniref:sensor histidine kinase n=1 Tax=Clostridium nigeriense TaxID=1805470 RepID=UPI003D337CF8